MNLPSTSRSLPGKCPRCCRMTGSVTRPPGRRSRRRCRCRARRQAGPRCSPATNPSSRSRSPFGRRPRCCRTAGSAPRPPACRSRRRHHCRSRSRQRRHRKQHPAPHRHALRLPRPAPRQALRRLSPHRVRPHRDHRRRHAVCCSQSTRRAHSPEKRPSCLPASLPSFGIRPKGSDHLRFIPPHTHNRSGRRSARAWQQPQNQPRRRPAGSGNRLEPLLHTSCIGERRAAASSSAAAPSESATHTNWGICPPSPPVVEAAGTTRPSIERQVSRTCSGPLRQRGAQSAISPIDTCFESGLTLPGHRRLVCPASAET